MKLIRFLRKIFLIDFVLGIFNSKQLPHLRFAKFLTVFSYMWLVLASLIVISLFNSVAEESIMQLLPIIPIAVISVGFFFLYRHTSKILKSYTEEEINSFGYLKYVNPVAPIIYFTTTFLIVLTIINMIMIFLLFMGALLFFLLLVITFGLLLLDDEFRLRNFISVPKEFFEIEEYFLKNMINPLVLIIFLLAIYFLIPLGTSAVVLTQHYRRKGAVKDEDGLS